MLTQSKERYRTWVSSSQCCYCCCFVVVCGLIHPDNTIPVWWRLRALTHFSLIPILMFCKWIKEPFNFFDHLPTLAASGLLPQNLLILKLDFGNKVCILCLCVYCFLRWDVRERHREDSYSHGERFLLRPTEGLTARDRGRPVTDKRRGKVSCIVGVGFAF